MTRLPSTAPRRHKISSRSWKHLRLCRNSTSTIATRSTTTSLFHLANFPMAITGFLPAVLGVAAVVATAGHLALVIANAQTPRSSTNIQQASIAAAALTGTTLVILVALLYQIIRNTVQQQSKKSSWIWLGTGFAASVLSALVSILSLVLTGNELDNATTVLGGSEATFLIASAVVLGLAFAAQLDFVLPSHVQLYQWSSEASQNRDPFASHAPQYPPELLFVPRLRASSSQRHPRHLCASYQCCLGSLARAGPLVPLRCSYPARVT